MADKISGAPVQNVFESTVTSAAMAKPAATRTQQNQSTKQEEDENRPLLQDKKDGKDRELKDSATTKPKKSSKLQFKKLDVQEFDRIFDDFTRTMNPFVTNRENLENAVAKFKTTVESLEEVRPQASFREYVKTLKTTLKKEGMFIKIKNGAVELYGVGRRTVTAGQNAVDAIKKIMTAAEGLKTMPDLVLTASRSSVQDAESSKENLQNIIRREFPGIFDICKINRFRRNLSNNITQLKSSPKMVTDFCNEVKEIVEEINKAFDEDKSEDDQDDNRNEEQSETTNKPLGNNEKTGNASAETNETDKDEDQNDAVNEAKKDEREKKKNKKKKDNKDDKKKEEEKKEFQKQLKMDTVGIPDIDKIFTDVMTTLNRFVSSRERLQSARESFEKIMKTLVNFDGEKEFKDYVQELKKKAKEGNIHIYIDTTDGDIKLNKVQGVDPPAPYRNAVKALNDVKTAAKSVEELEPHVQSGLESCGRDVAKIEPLRDFKKMVSGTKEVLKIPKKAKAFNENRKKVQKAPQIVREFGLYVKDILVDIVKVFCEEEEEKKKEDKENEVEKEGKNESEEKEQEGEEDDDKESAVDTHKIKAEVHQPRKAENVLESENKNIEV